MKKYLITRIVLRNIVLYSYLPYVYIIIGELNIKNNITIFSSLVTLFSFVSIIFGTFIKYDYNKIYPITVLNIIVYLSIFIMYFFHNIISLYLIMVLIASTNFSTYLYKPWLDTLIQSLKFTKLERRSLYKVKLNIYYVLGLIVPMISIFFITKFKNKVWLFFALIELFLLVLDIKNKKRISELIVNKKKIEKAQTNFCKINNCFNITFWKLLIMMLLTTCISQVGMTIIARNFILNISIYYKILIISILSTISLLIQSKYVKIINTKLLFISFTTLILSLTNVSIFIILLVISFTLLEIYTVLLELEYIDLFDDKEFIVKFVNIIKSIMTFSNILLVLSYNWTNSLYLYPLILFSLFLLISLNSKNKFNNEKSR